MNFDRIDSNKTTFEDSNETLLNGDSGFQSMDPENKEIFSGRREETENTSSLRQTKKTSKIDVSAPWNKHKEKIMSVAFNALAFLASPVVYSISFTVGFILNATKNHTIADKISNFIENCKNYGKPQFSFDNNKETRPVVVALVGLLAVGFAPARWAFSGAVAFDAGRSVQEKASQWVQEFKKGMSRKKNESNYSEIETK